MDLHGKKSTGGFGVLNAAEIQKLLETHVGGRLTDQDKAALLRLANDFITHNGNAGQGSGAISEWKYAGNTVFHRTALGGAYTLFFYRAVANSPIGGICGIGTHRSNDTYTMIWRKHNWGAPIVNI
jgi:hypothetical protein